jgi:hypothetical protein
VVGTGPGIHHPEVIPFLTHFVSLIGFVNSKGFWVEICERSHIDSLWANICSIWDKPIQFNLIILQCGWPSLESQGIEQGGGGLVKSLKNATKVLFQN